MTFVPGYERHYEDAQPSAPRDDPLADLLRMVGEAREAKTSDWPIPDEEWARIGAEWADRHYARKPA